MTPPLVAVLAGTASTRMGEDKALVAVGGRTMAEWVVQAAASIGPLLAVGRPGTLAGVSALPDPPGERRGPLAGLVTALEASAGRPVLLLAVDQPWVRPATLSAIVARGSDEEAVVPVDGGHRQTTCALYPASLRAAALVALEAGGSLRSLLADCPRVDVAPAEWREWGEDGRSWYSVDSRRALRRGLDRFGLPGD